MLEKNDNKIGRVNIEFKMEFIILFCDVLVLFFGINNEINNNYIYVYFYEWFLCVIKIF